MMTVWIENEYDYTFDFPYEETAKLVAEEVLRQEACPWESEINLLLTGYAEIRETNRTFRDIDRETDVLSFPSVDFQIPAGYDIIDENADAYFNPDSGELMLGDIMICVPRLREQAKEYGHGEKREFAFLIAHSMLHLLGYDHMEPEEAAVMEEKQEQVLRSLKITR